MRKVLVILISLAVIVLGVAYFSGWFSSSTSGAGRVSNPAPIGGGSGTAAQTTTTTQTTPATAATRTTPAATTTAASPATTEEVPYVKFDFVITGITGSGFTRTVTVRVANTGNEDAHNVRGVVQVLQGDSVIKINGEDSLTVEVGPLPAGSAVTVEQSIKFGLLDGLKIQSNGAEFSVTLYSDEATQSFSEFYQP